jgi:hypothetical protein
MADNLTDTAENLMLDWILGTGTPTRPSGTFKCRLMTANGTDTVAGTEVVGGTYTSQTVTFNAAASGATANVGALTFTLMPAVTVTAVEIWDGAGTPVRLWYGTLTAPKTTNAGDTFTIPAGDLDLTLS